jgi:sulfite exporter TauE/SafE
MNLLLVLTGSLSTLAVLGFGFVLGLKHAVEADHLAAVSTIVSERKSLLSSSLVGGLWGVGHTFSLLVAGVAVILLHVEISERVAEALEFCVGLMLVALGLNALRKLLRSRELHLHAHSHGGRAHIHPHLHGPQAETDPHTHHGLRLDKGTGMRLGARPLLVGMVHGFAGSAVLTLLVLSTISSPFLGLLYIIIFGAGSIGGMMLMSALVGLPLHFTAARFTRANVALRCLAGLFSLSFGLLMVYRIGFAGGLFR